MAISWFIWVTALYLIIGGALAASSLILAKKPNAKDLFAKITPYQGTIGGTMFLWGIFDLVFHFLFQLGDWKFFFAGPIFWKIFAIAIPVAYLLELGIGFLLGFGMINAFAIKKNPQMAAKAEGVLKKLAPWQGTLGIIGIITGIYWLLFALFLWKIGIGA